MRLLRVFAVFCVVSLVVATGCSTRGPSAGRSARAVVGTRLPAVRLTPREGVHYFNEGVQAAQETSVAIGVLRYRATSKTEGTWLVVSRESPAVLASEARPLATLTGDAGFDKDFWPLDGQYVAAEGPVLSASGRVRHLRVEALCRVSDMFPPPPDVIDSAGLYHMLDGSMRAVGWIGEASETVTTLYDRPPDAAGLPRPRPIARVMHEKQDNTFSLKVMDADVYLYRKEDPPLVRAIGGHAGYSSGIGRQWMGRRRQWLGMERAGVKDLPGGRTRVVGVIVREDYATRRPIPVGIGIAEPRDDIYISFSYRMLVTLTGPAALAVPDAEYVAAEGLLEKTEQGYTLEAEDVRPIPTPAERAAVPPKNLPE